MMQVIELGTIILCVVLTACGKSTKIRNRKYGLGCVFCSVSEISGTVQVKLESDSELASTTKVSDTFLPSSHEDVALPTMSDETRLSHSQRKKKKRSISTQRLKIGKAINIFDAVTHSHASNIPEINIFSDIKTSMVLTDDKGSITIVLCEDILDLRKAHINSFQLIGSSWEIAENSFSWMNGELDLPPEYAHSSNFIYLLVKYTLKGPTISLQRAHSLIPEVHSKLSLLESGDVESALSFISLFGTHFLTSCTMGNSLYQVIVYKKQNYKHLNSMLHESGKKGKAQWMLELLQEPVEFLTNIKDLNNKIWYNSTQITEAKDAAFQNSVNLLHLLSLPNNEIPAIQHEMSSQSQIVQMKLQTIDYIVQNTTQRFWLRRILLNRLRLYDSNL